MNREPRAGLRVELGSWYGRRSTSEGLDSFVRHNGVETLTLLEESVRSSRRAKNRFHTVVHSTRVCIFRRMVSLTHFTRGAISIWMGWVNQRRTYLQFIELLNAIRDKHLVPGAPRGEYLKDYQPKADPRTLDGLPMSDLGPGLERPRTKRQMALAALRDHQSDDEEDIVVAATPQRGVSDLADTVTDGGGGGRSGRSKREAGSRRAAQEEGSRRVVVGTPGTPPTPEVRAD